MDAIRPNRSPRPYRARDSRRLCRVSLRTAKLTHYRPFRVVRCRFAFGGIVVFDVKSNSNLRDDRGAIVHGVNAKVEFFSVMNVEELQEGVRKLQVHV